VPANPTDGYIPTSIDRLERAIDRYRSERRELLATIEELAPLPAGPVAEALAAYPPSRAVPGEVVRRRRHLTLRRLLASPPDPNALATAVIAAAASSDAAALADAIGGREPEQIIDAIYRVVLRREADPHGISSWVEVLGQGISPLEIARLIAESDEARALGQAHEATVAEALERAYAHLLLRELTRPVAEPVDLAQPTPAIHALLVTSVYEVCFGRRPTAEELAIDTSRLVRGTSRDRLIAMHARNPEAWRRVMGWAPTGFAGRVQRRLGRRRVTARIRHQVAAAEIRGVAASGLLAGDLSADVRDRRKVVA